MDLDRLSPTIVLLSKTALANDPDVYVLLTRVRSRTRCSCSAQRRELVCFRDRSAARAVGPSLGPAGNRRGPPGRCGDQSQLPRLTLVYDQGSASR